MHEREAEQKRARKRKWIALLKKAAAIAKENGISFISGAVSGTRSGLVTVGDASELLTISFLITANVAVSAGIPVEKLVEKSEIIFEEMYEKARRLHEGDDRR